MDFITDRSKRVVSFVKDALPDIPYNLKEAAEAYSPSAFTDYPNSAFADPVTKEFPLVSDDTVMWSGLYASATHLNDQRVMDRIKQAAVNRGVDEWLFPAMDRIRSTFTKQASEVSYALVINNEGDILRHYPISTDLQVEESAKVASRDFADGRIPLELFVDASREMVKAAADHGNVVRLPQVVLDYGTERMASREALIGLIEKRASRVKDEAYTMLASAIPEDLDQQTAKQAVDLICRLDQEHGIDYTKNDMVDPYRTVFSGPRLDDLAKEASTKVMVQDVIIPGDVIAGIPDTDIQLWSSEEDMSKASYAVKCARENDYATSDRILNELSGETQERLFVYLDRTHAS